MGKNEEKDEGKKEEIKVKAVEPEEITGETELGKEAKVSFVDKKKARALRFGIPLVENSKTVTDKGKRSRNKKENRNEQQKKQKLESEVISKEESEKRLARAQRFRKADDMPKVISRIEIEKRLARAEKFGLLDKVDELKSLLRQHRFAK